MFRFDRFLTLHVFRHLGKVLPQTEGIRIPILMYHSISDEPEKGHPYFWINTSPNRFAEHMQFLHKNNYKVISLSEAFHIIESQTIQQHRNTGLPNTQNSTLNTRFIVLTFDDGYRDFLTQAFPILKKYGFQSTVFLPTKFVKDKKEQGLKGKEHLSWSEVRGLQKNGIRFGSHTVNHRQLINLDESTIRFELKVSKEVIEDQTGEKVEDFSYPYRFPTQDKTFIKNLENWLREYKYKQGISTRIGTTHKPKDRFSLKRIPINSLDDLPLFQAKICGDYDWLRVPQNLTKQFKIRKNDG